MIKEITLQLVPQYSDAEARSIAILLMCNITGLSYTELLIHTPSLNEEQEEELRKKIERVKKNEPLQYILGETIFFGRRFKCDRRALIPRPETEELIDWIINDASNNTNISILDIGCGSGCIAITLAKELKNSIVTALDISKEAISLTEENCKINNCQVECINDDIFNFSDAQYDIIVSNPPYICDNEAADIESNVIDYEPHLALFVPDNSPLKFYEKITEYAARNLRSRGKLYFEINRKYGKEMQLLLEKFGFINIELRKDISNNDRMIKGEKR
mgnify:FL=1